MLLKYSILYVLENVGPKENVGRTHVAPSDLGARKPSQYYRLPTMTLQDHAMNCMFNNGGRGYEMLPTPLKRLYYEHIHCIPK